MAPIASQDPLLVAGCILVVSLLCGELAGRLAARLEPKADERFRSQVGAVQGAVLGLVGLLLAFSFSMAVARFETRRDLVLEEADAIGTTFLRADFLPEPARTEAKALLREYVTVRIAYYAVGEDRSAIEDEIRASEALQARIWALVAREASGAPQSLPLSLLVTTLNEVIDLHAGRVVAHDARVPDALIVLQIALVVIGVATIAFGFGLFRGPHRAGTLLLSILMAGILLMILDLDQPRRGFIRVSQEAMVRLQDNLDAP
ncbi:MAG: hypothetical protein V4850_34290 [Myxococcota bacterium]